MKKKNYTQDVRSLLLRQKQQIQQLGDLKKKKNEYKEINKIKQRRRVGREGKKREETIEYLVEYKQYIAIKVASARGCACALIPHTITIRSRTYIHTHLHIHAYTLYNVKIACLHTKQKILQTNETERTRVCASLSR